MRPAPAPRSPVVLLPLALLLSFAPPAAAAPAPEARRLAVLEFDNELPRGERIDRTYFADKVREVTRRTLPADRFFIMTRESTEELLRAAGRSLSDCVGNCEVETGKLLMADLVLSGRLTRVGSRLKLSMRLHQTRDGALLASATASGSSQDQLDDDTARAAEELLAPLGAQHRAPAAPAVAGPRPAAVVPTRTYDLPEKDEPLFARVILPRFNFYGDLAGWAKVSGSAFAHRASARFYGLIGEARLEYGNVTSLQKDGSFFFTYGFGVAPLHWGVLDPYFLLRKRSQDPDEVGLVLGNRFTWQNWSVSAEFEQGNTRGEGGFSVYLGMAFGGQP